MGAGHHHGHSHGPVEMESVNKAFMIGILLNVVFTAIEYFMGFYYNSLALLSDASHNLSDVASLVLSLVGMKLAQKAASAAYTFGYKKATILASLINAILLVVVVVGIISEAIERLTAPMEVMGMSLVVVAAIGVVINTISAFLFFKDQKKDINIKGAFIHLLVDALVSVGVVVSGLVIYYTGWNIIDPIISIGIALIIIFSTWGLLKESIRLTIDAVPKGIDLPKVKDEILAVKGVLGAHHIHIWAISSTINALTAHIEIAPSSSEEMQPIKEEIKDKLHHMNIAHATLEFETVEEDCKHKDYM